TGDFNTLEDETPNAVEDVLLDPKYGLFDMYDLAEAYRNPMLNKMPPASYYYGKDDNWNEFDRIVISKNLIDEKGVDAEPRTFRIHAPKFLTKTNSRGEAIPFRYNHHAHNPKWLGYSDHFGVVVRFTYEPARLQDNEE